MSKIKCRINGKRDLGMTHRGWIGKECVIIKHTKGGLIQVKNMAGEINSFPPANVDIKVQMPPEYFARSMARRIVHPPIEALIAIRKKNV